MKKKLLLLSALFISIGLLSANPVSVSTAQTVAANFYSQTTKITNPGLTLVFTETCLELYYELRMVHKPVYYVFNVNDENGFVITSADDAANPIIGYSTKGHFVIPEEGSNVDYWLQKQKTELTDLIASGTQASSAVANEWNSYLYPSTNNQHSRLPHSSSVTPLCQTTWNQPSPYNAMCPDGSVTGCVATCMAQVVKYWNYPPHGMGSSFYYETSPENYGLLQANYDTSNYVWSAMPNNVTVANKEVAKLMYDCGVSVDMGYSPSESGAWVITADDPICAQTSYVKYFGYNPYTIQGIKRKNYSDSAWMAIIENELNNRRVTEYAGWDSVNGGHTWVCDGYDTNGFLHMNWGWSGSDDGYYELDTLNPYPYFFSKTEELITGIEPPSVVASFVASPLNGCAGITVNFTDRSFVYDTNSPITSRQWSFPGGYPSTSNSPTQAVVYSVAGTYPVTLMVANNLGADTMTKTSYITINAQNVLPLSQNFEGSFPPAQFTINNPWLHSATWEQYTGTGGYGNSSHCMYYNNCSAGVKGQNDQIYTPSYDFTNSVNPYIYFDVAYTPYNQTYTDSLAVYYSLDCGNTFTRVFINGGMNLCTTGGITLFDGANANNNGCFVPLSSNWKTDTIFIPAIAGQSDVMFSFENRSGNGSNLYIDNINVPVATGVTEVGTQNFVSEVYPNPNNGNFSLEINSTNGGEYELSVYNESGQKVIAKTLQVSANEYLYPVNLSNFGKGIYSIMLRQGQNQYIKKVAVL